MGWVSPLNEMYEGMSSGSPKKGGMVPEKILPARKPRPGPRGALDFAHEEWRTHRKRAKDRWKSAKEGKYAIGFTKAVRQEKLAQDKRRSYLQEKGRYKEAVRTRKTPEQHRHGRRGMRSQQRSFPVRTERGGKR
jgi:hypothetical protein